MLYTTISYPTKYDGVLFRSRLEARWAAMFDILEWGWDYEPFDLNGWVPDFQLNLPRCKDDKSYYGLHYVKDQTPLVEIKPVKSTQCELKDFDIHRIYQSLGIVGRCSSCPREVLLLGNSPDHAWKTPDLGDWKEALPVSFFKEAFWKEAGNRVQWSPTNA